MMIEVASTTQKRIAELVASGDFPDAETAVAMAVEFYWAHSSEGWAEGDPGEVRSAIAEYKAERAVSR